MLDRLKVKPTSTLICVHRAELVCEDCKAPLPFVISYPDRYLYLVDNGLSETRSRLVLEIIG